MATNISTELKKIDISKEFDKLHQLLESAQTQVSLWGTREITFHNFYGAIPLDEFSSRVIQPADLRCASDDLTPTERVIGLKIADKLQELYRATDKQVCWSNIFTRLVVWIREKLDFFPYNPRFYIMNQLKNVFKAFSETRFRETFDWKESLIEHHPDCDGAFGPPARHTIKEEAIQRLVEKEKAQKEASAKSSGWWRS